MDLNHGPSGYEPDELPDCSTPRRALYKHSEKNDGLQTFNKINAAPLQPSAAQHKSN